MTQSTQDMLYDHVRNTARMLDEIWDAIDAPDCEACEGIGWDDEGTDCETCEGKGKVTTYEGQDAREYLDEMPLEVVWEKGEPFAIVLGTGGPHIEIRGGTRHDGMGYQVYGYWAGESSTWGSEGVTKTGEYFREMVEESEPDSGIDEPISSYGMSRYQFETDLYRLGL